MAKATLAPIPTMHRQRITVAYDGEYAEPILPAMAINVKIYLALETLARHPRGSEDFHIPSKQDACRTGSQKG